MYGLDDYKLDSNEDALLSAEEMDAQIEAEQAAALESLRQVAEDFCDYVNTKTYFGDWYAEIVEGKVLIVNDEAGNEATHEFEMLSGCPCIGRGTRGLNWFSHALTGYMADWVKSRAEMEAKKAAPRSKIVHAEYLPQLAK